MKKTALLCAPGFEEIEALTPVDLLRRAQIVCDIISTDDGDTVAGSHSITVTADRRFSETDFSAYDGLILPGGLAGTKKLLEDERVLSLLREFRAAGKLTAAICAGPTVLGKAGLLKGKTACCYPGVEDQLVGAQVSFDTVCVDGTVITSRGMGTAVPFALALVSCLCGPEQADALAAKIVYR